MNRSFHFAILAAATLGLVACKKEGDFLNWQDNPSKSSSEQSGTFNGFNEAGQIDDAQYTTLQQGIVSANRFVIGSTKVRVMDVGYAIGINVDNQVRVSAAARWIAGNPPPGNTPPEIDIMLMMSSPSIPRAYVRAHVIVPPPSTGFGPGFHVYANLDNLATFDGAVDFLSAEEASELLREGSVIGFRP
jgi:hypothetical protein